MNTCTTSTILDGRFALSDPVLEICQPGLTSYETAWQWQRQRVQLQKQSPLLPDGLLLLRHPPVYTLGQGADPHHLLFDRSSDDYEVHRVDRGGDVTYHGPGQWVGYPILNLCRHQQDLHWYLRQLEHIIIAVLADLGLKGERISGLTGVWVEGAKVAAIGIKVSRWISFHGFALNICPEMEAFQRIIPCGITDRPVGSLQQFLPHISLSEVEILLIKHFCQHFHLSPSPVSLQQWLRQDDFMPQPDQAPLQNQQNQSLVQPNNLLA